MTRLSVSKFLGQFDAQLEKILHILSIEDNIIFILTLIRTFILFKTKRLIFISSFTTSVPFIILFRFFDSFLDGSIKQKYRKWRTKRRDSGSKNESVLWTPSR